MRPNDRKPKNPPNSPSVELKHKEVLKRVKSVARKRGIPFPKKPASDVPELPRDVTKISSAQLGKLYQLFAGHQSYAVVHHALADIEKSLLQHEIRLFSARFRVAEDDDSAKWKLEDRMFTDEEYRKLDFLFQRASAYEQLLEALVEGIAIKVQALSREISRREQEYQNVGRL